MIRIAHCLAGALLLTQPALSQGLPPQMSVDSLLASEGRTEAKGTAASAKPAAPARKPSPAPKREAFVSDDPHPTFEAETAARTAVAMARYEAMVAAGGWPNVPAGLTPDKQAAEVTLLRHRLAIEGYLPPDASTGEAWDDALTQAVKSFQTNMGLQPTGIPAGATLKALNVTAAERLQALRGSLRRLAGTTFGFGPRHVVVNIPSAAVEAIENGRVVRRYTAVVGDRAHRSPEIAARVQSINLNPTWTVPASIIKNEIIPQMRKNPHYLSKSKIRIFDGKGLEVDPQTMDWSGEKAVGYLFRQDAGAQNSLGSIRINMPNREAVYMHDTPSKRSFSADDRFLSHGCVRVQGVYDLAAWLLEETAGTRWDRMTLLAEASDGQSAEIKLSKSVPVIWVYLTAWAGLDGAMHFRPDVYGYDTFDADAIRAALN